MQHQFAVRTFQIAAAFLRPAYGQVAASKASACSPSADLRRSRPDPSFRETVARVIDAYHE